MYLQKYTTSSLFLLQMQSKIQRKGFPSLTMQLFLKGKWHNACTSYWLFKDKKGTDWTPPPLFKHVTRVIGTEGFGRTLPCSATGIERKQWQKVNTATNSQENANRDVATHSHCWYFTFIPSSWEDGAKPGFLVLLLRGHGERFWSVV